MTLIELECCLHIEIQSTGQEFWPDGYKNKMQMKGTPPFKVQSHGATYGSDFLNSHNAAKSTKQTHMDLHQKMKKKAQDPYSVQYLFKITLKLKHVHIELNTMQGGEKTKNFDS